MLKPLSLVRRVHTHLHIRKPGDANNVFALCFNTPAPDKTGVPHILEHTTLCGSKQFPVRDPFFKMLNRSLANFMNAMTGLDYTYYPFATTNKRDFENLLKVYTDSVFNPLLRKNDFLQEGWRLAKDNEGKPKFEGVVFNEMRGQNSIPSYLFYTKWLESVYPAVQNSGGEPFNIPDLSYEQLLKFHRDHYNWDNCFSYSYSDEAPDNILNMISQYKEQNGHNYSTNPAYKESLKASLANPTLKTIETSEGVATLVQYPSIISKADSTSAKKILPISLPANTVAYGPPDANSPESKKISLTWYLDDTSPKHVLRFQFLFLLLCDGHSSPMHEKLISSKIGVEFSANSGVEEFNDVAMFTIGLNGVHAPTSEVEDAILKTLEEVTTKKFSKERVNALFHQFEMGLLEVDANYGLNMLNQIVTRASNNREYLPLLDMRTMLNELKAEVLKNPEVFVSYISNYLKSKPYFKFEQLPSASYEKEIENQLQQKAEKVAINHPVEALENSNANTENVDCLPTLTTEDINPKINRYSVDRTMHNKIQFIHRDTNTRGITYVSMLRNLNIAPEYLPYLPLYSAALTNIGTKNREIATLEQEINTNTGGISVSCGVRSWGAVEMQYSSNALDSDLPKMYDLLEDVISNPNFENVDKIKLIVDAAAANVADALSQSGHRAAIMFASSKVNKVSAIQERIRGVPYIQLMKRLSGLDAEAFKSEIIPKLNEIHRIVTMGSVRAFGITGKTDGAKEFADTTFSNSVIPENSTKDDLSDKIAEPETIHSALQMPLQVSHVGCAISSSLGPLSREGAALQVFAQILTQRYLHPEIREKGGAYGGGASYNNLQGVFNMFSYRDPTPSRSISIFQQMNEWASNYAITERDLQEGKIGIFQSLDAPISPRNEITRYVFSQLTDDERQIYRKNLISVTAEDIKAALPKLRTRSICVVGPGAPENYKQVEI